MMRSSVVLPEPEGPSSASSSPCFTSSLTASSATVPSNRLLRSRTSMPMLPRSREGELAGVTPFEEPLDRQRDQRKRSEERCDGKGRNDVVLIVEDLDL